MRRRLRRRRRRERRRASFSAESLAAGAIRSLWLSLDSLFGGERAETPRGTSRGTWKGRERERVWEDGVEVEGFERKKTRDGCQDREKRNKKRGASPAPVDALD
jgi:hypothetical protein